MVALGSIVDRDPSTANGRHVSPRSSHSAMRTLPTLLLACATSVSASADVVISNLATSVGAGAAFGATTSPPFRAFGFTMGATAYSLDEVVLGFNFPVGMQDPLATIWSDAGGSPGVLLHSLVSPGGPFSGNMDLIFTASGAFTLDPSTTYWLQVEPGPLNVGGFRWTGSNPITTPTGVATAVSYFQPTPTTSTAQERLEIRGTPGAGGLGSVYCAPAVPNATGVPGELSAQGSPLVASNDVTLEASAMPTNTFGYFLTSTTQGQLPNPGGSVGTLCLAGAIGRYVGPGQIQNSGATGAFALVLDLTQTPTPTGPVTISAGETWNFQVWYRDSLGGNATSNFTSAVSVAFQ
jgi:hypothetical protein